MNDQNLLIYKIETKTDWEKAIRAGTYLGAPIDLTDGFIHFSTAMQARVTAAKHFTARGGLIIAAINAASLGNKLKWEVSRDDALFPHLYGPLDMTLVVATHDLPLDPQGIHVFPEAIF